MFCATECVNTNGLTHSSGYILCIYFETINFLFFESHVCYLHNVQDKVKMFNVVPNMYPGCFLVF